MAVYVKMIKKFDDEKRVVYQFGPNEKQMGEIEFDKEKKIFNILNRTDGLAHPFYSPHSWRFCCFALRTQLAKIKNVKKALSKQRLTILLLEC